MLNLFKTQFFLVSRLHCYGRYEFFNNTQLYYNIIILPTLNATALTYYYYYFPLVLSESLKMHSNCTYYHSYYYTYLPKATKFGNYPLNVVPACRKFKTFVRQYYKPHRCIQSLCYDIHTHNDNSNNNNNYNNNNNDKGKGDTAISLNKSNRS